MGEKIKTNARFLKDVSSFLSNSIGPSNNTQQWGMKPSEEEIVKVEAICYNEGYRVHITKELAIFSNSHTKSDQGKISTHNRHLGRCPMFGD
jgi:hypothetical protein